LSRILKVQVTVRDSAHFKFLFFISKFSFIETLISGIYSLFWASSDSKQ